MKTLLYVYGTIFCILQGALFGMQTNNLTQDLEHLQMLLNRLDAQLGAPHIPQPPALERALRATAIPLPLMPPAEQIPVRSAPPIPQVSVSTIPAPILPSAFMPKEIGKVMTTTANTWRWDSGDLRRLLSDLVVNKFVQEYGVDKAIGNFLQALQVVINLDISKWKKDGGIKSDEINNLIQAALGLDKSMVAFVRDGQVKQFIQRLYDIAQDPGLSATDALNAVYILKMLLEQFETVIVSVDRSEERLGEKYERYIFEDVPSSKLWVGNRVSWRQIEQVLDIRTYLFTSYVYESWKDALARTARYTTRDDSFKFGNDLMLLIKKFEQRAQQPSVPSKTRVAAEKTVNLFADPYIEGNAAWGYGVLGIERLLKARLPQDIKLKRVPQLDPSMNVGLQFITNIDPARSKGDRLRGKLETIKKQGAQENIVVYLMPATSTRLTYNDFESKNLRIFPLYLGSSGQSGLLLQQEDYQASELDQQEVQEVITENVHTLEVLSQTIRALAG